jgi:hypothetical protein
VGDEPGASNEAPDWLAVLSTGGDISSGICIDADEGCKLLDGDVSLYL